MAIYWYSPLHGYSIEHMTNKAQLRRRLLAALPPTVVTPSADMIAQFKQLALPSVGRVLAYYALPGEIDPMPLLGILDESVMVDFVPQSPSAALPTVEYDLILIPCLGYTADGYRLGRGGGWYDRLLATQSGTLSVGLAHGRSLVSFTPEQHDVPLAHILAA